MCFILKYELHIQIFLSNWYTFSVKGIRTVINSNKNIVEHVH